MSEKSDLFIPKRICVGFQNREDTYSKRLAYVIYYDFKGTLRKEKSWETWRDKGIEPEEYDNEPTEGFVLNKGIRRFGWSHFGSNRSYIRVYDPRGIEFEITPENLIGILMDAGCAKRELQGKYVYAWSGDRLVLLPCGSEEYQQAVENTERQAQDISAKDLKPGCSYTTKRGEEVIYLGRFARHEWTYRSDKRNRKKVYVFVDPTKAEGEKALTNVKFMSKGDVKFLASLNNEEPVPNYADLIEEWNGDIRSSKIVGWEFEPLSLTEIKTRKDTWGRPVPERSTFMQVQGDLVLYWHLELNTDTRYVGNQYEHNVVGYFLYRHGGFNMKTQGRDYSYDTSRYNYWGQRREASLSEAEALAELQSKGCVEVYVVLESGKKVRLDKVFYPNY